MTKINEKIIEMFILVYHKEISKRDVIYFFINGIGERVSTTRSFIESYKYRYTIEKYVALICKDKNL